MTIRRAMAPAIWRMSTCWPSGVRITTVLRSFSVLLATTAISAVFYLLVVNFFRSPRRMFKGDSHGTDEYPVDVVEAAQSGQEVCLGLLRPHHNHTFHTGPARGENRIDEVFKGQFVGVFVFEVPGGDFCHRLESPPFPYPSD